jgi:hypothetical protein
VRILVVATKAPWPTFDGGRLLLFLTLEALAAAGHQATLVAPVDPGRFDLDEVGAALANVCHPRLVAARPAHRFAALVRSRLHAAPLSVARHTLPAVAREVARLAGSAAHAGRPFDLVHAEQLQAVPQAAAAGLPLVLRAQNVESDLWGAASRRRGGLAGRLLASEARRLAAFEGAAVRRAAATVALTAADAARLADLAGSTGFTAEIAAEIAAETAAGAAAGAAAGTARVHTVAAPFPSRLPAGSTALFGDPAVVLLGSAGWLPNADSAAWFVDAVWPEVRHGLHRAVLHLFGAPGAGDRAGVVAHPPPSDSAEAFAPRSILVVPVRIASGVRMKVLEAWARGVPVVATPEAMAGLDAAHGREVLVAQDAGEFAAAIARLHREPALGRALVAAGRRALAVHHAPAAVAARLAEIYAAVGPA